MRLDIQLFADGKVVIETKLDTSGFEDGIDDMEKDSKISQFIESIQEKLSKIGDDFAKIGKKAGKGIKGIATKIAGIGKLVLSYIPQIISAVIKFGAILTASLGVVALLGLAFIAIMQAMEKVGEEHEELATQIQYIVYVIKQGLAPIVEWIANAIATIIQKAINGILFILALIARLTGNKLPSGKDFAENMKNADKSSSGVAKNAKEINKQLAGFDEMNVLQDNKGGGSAGGGVSAPDIGMIDGAIEEANQKVDNLFTKISEWWENHWLKKKIEEWKKDWADGWDTMKEKWTEFKENWLIGWGIIKDWFKETWENIKQWFSDAKDWIVQKWDELKEKITKFFKETLPTAVEDAKKWLKEKVEEIKNNIQETIRSIPEWINTNIIEKIKTKFNEFKEKIIGIWTNIKDKATEIFTNIKTFITDKIITPVVNKFNEFKTKITTIFNNVKDALKGPLNTIIGWINKLIDGFNKIKITIPSWVNDLIGKGKKETTFGFNLKKVPTLAKGGIINMPGKGTMVGSAIAGEAGREAVLPLTDSQQMELLGEAIGRYITINANITNTMNGRIISRELQKINNENSFAGNR